jgi:hypothetical protein
MEFLSAAEPVTASVVVQRGASAPDATAYATGRSVLAIPRRVVVSPNVCAARLGPRAQHVGILEHTELLVTSAAANERNDVGIRRTNGAREFP